MLIRNAEALELLEKMSVLVVDKTGTLTEGKPKLIRVLAMNGSSPVNAHNRLAPAESTPAFAESSEPPGRLVRSPVNAHNRLAPAESTPAFAESSEPPGRLVRSEDEVLRLAASLEQSSEHPLAGAIIAGAQERGIRLGKATGFQSVTGKGISGTVDGKADHGRKPQDAGGDRDSP